MIVCAAGLGRQQVVTATGCVIWSDLLHFRLVANRCLLCLRVCALRRLCDCRQEWVGQQLLQ